MIYMVLEICYSYIHHFGTIANLRKATNSPGFNQKLHCEKQGSSSFHAVVSNRRLRSVRVTGALFSWHAQ